VGENLYLDHRQNKTGYVALNELINNEKYQSVISVIRNNTNCPLFDAARGAILFGDTITDIVRIYSEHIGPDMLKLIQKHFEE
jgi:hypothetical protein